MNKIEHFSDRCRCCLKTGHLIDMWSVFTHDGQEEIYGELLIECFAISLQPSECKDHICTACIKRLRDAYKFRMLVLASQEHLFNDVKEEGVSSIRVKNISSLRFKEDIKEEEEVTKEIECTEENVQYLFCDEAANKEQEPETVEDEEYIEESTSMQLDDDSDEGVEYLEVEFLDEGDNATEAKQDNVGGRKRRTVHRTKMKPKENGSEIKQSSEENVDKGKPKDDDCETKRKPRQSEDTVKEKNSKRKDNIDDSIETERYPEQSVNERKRQSKDNEASNVKTKRNSEENVNERKRKPKDSTEDRVKTKRKPEKNCDERKPKDRGNETKMRRKNKWRKTKEFQSAEEAESYVKSMKLTIFTKHNGLDGLKVNYRCSLGAYRRNECPAQFYLLYHKDATTVSLFETSDHANHTDGLRGLKFSTRELIKQMYKEGIRKPRAIIAAFRTRGLQAPEKIKLNNFLATIRVQKSDPTEISTELKAWCQRKSVIPESLDEAFVLSYKIDIQDENIKDLKIVISTKRLIQLSCQSNGVQADSTNNLTWQGYPMLIVGTSDMDRVFHPIAIAICKEDKEIFEFIFTAIKDSCRDILQATWKPVVLLADTSDAITNGFVKAFGPPYRRLQCNLNMLKNIDLELKDIKSKYLIRRDIEELNLCTDDASFNVASKLFLQKWKNVNEHAINEFLKHFEAVWLGKHRFWYEGACRYYPSTNIGLESVYDQIKNECRRRKPVLQFLDKIENVILKNWSMERDSQNPNFKPFYIEPVRCTNVWIETYQWLKTNPKMYKEKGPNETVFYVLPYDMQSTVLNDEHFKSYKNKYLQWSSFEEFTSCSKSLFKVKCLNQNDTVSTICNCPGYMKKYVCKHNLGVLVFLGKEKVPENAKYNQIERKRGRTSIAKKGSQAMEESSP